MSLGCFNRDNWRANFAILIFAGAGEAIDVVNASVVLTENREPRVQISSEEKVLRRRMRDHLGEFRHYCTLDYAAEALCRDQLARHLAAGKKAVTAVEVQTDCLPYRNIILEKRGYVPLSVESLQSVLVRFRLLGERKAVLEPGRIFLRKVIEKVGGPVILLGRGDESHRTRPQRSDRKHLWRQGVDSSESFRVPA